MGELSLHTVHTLVLIRNCRFTILSFCEYIRTTSELVWVTLLCKQPVVNNLAYIMIFILRLILISPCVYLADPTDLFFIKADFRCPDLSSYVVG